MAMVVVIAVQSGYLVHAQRIMQRRRVPTRRGGGHDEIPRGHFKNVSYMWAM